MSGRVRWIGVIGMVATGAVALAGCSDPTDATQNATTSTSATRSTAPPTTRVPAAPQLPGLWVATSAGIVDESGQRYASPAEGSNEVLRSLVDDGAGGVFYLRCPEGAASDCAVEHAHEPNGEPVELGRAEELLAVGTWGERPVLAVTAIEPTSEATSKPGDEAGGETGGGDPATQAPAQAPPRAVGHLLDPETGELVGTFDWYDAQRGPIALDLAAGTIVACVGEGERCEIGSSSDPATLPNAIDGIEPDLTV
ncbi:MAG: hypothetical protein GX868_04300, partial [Actinobacteria bacterium]|nr:hypothetical protein [Actinomycetota bacterium]